MLSKIPLNNLTEFSFTIQGNKTRLEIVETLNRVLSINLKGQKLGTVNVLNFSTLEFIYNTKLYSQEMDLITHAI